MEYLNIFTEEVNVAVLSFVLGVLVSMASYERLFIDWGQLERILAYWEREKIKIWKKWRAWWQKKRRK